MVTNRPASQRLRVWLVESLSSEVPTPIDTRVVLGISKLNLRAGKQTSLSCEHVLRDLHAVAC